MFDWIWLCFFQMEATINVETQKTKFVDGKSLAVQLTVNFEISYTVYFILKILSDDVKSKNY